MSLIGAPLPSATYAGSGFGYYAPRDAAGQLVGVTNLNGLIGQVAITADTSITVSTPGLGAVNVSTAGNPQVPSSVACTGAMSAATLVVPGVCTLGGTNVAGLSSTGNVYLTGTASMNAAGSITCANFINSTPNTVTLGPLTGAVFGIGTGNYPGLNITAAVLAPLANYKIIRARFTGLVVNTGGPATLVSFGFSTANAVLSPVDFVYGFIANSGAVPSVTVTGSPSSAQPTFILPYNATTIGSDVLTFSVTSSAVGGFLGNPSIVLEGVL